MDNRKTGFIEMTREELIKLTALGLVPVEKWRNRDSFAAQMQLGMAGALLRAHCPFEILTNESAGHLSSDEATIWIRIKAPTFETVDYGEDPAKPDTWPGMNYYIPTGRRIKQANGNDWY